MSVIKENISSTFALFNRIVYYLFDKIKIIIFEGRSNNEKLKLNTFILGLHLNNFYYYSLNMYFIFFIVLTIGFVLEIGSGAISLDKTIQNKPNKS